jgi:hypothetical protein
MELSERNSDEKKAGQRVTVLLSGIPTYADASPPNIGSQFGSKRAKLSWHE